MNKSSHGRLNQNSCFAGYLKNDYWYISNNPTMGHLVIGFASLAPVAERLKTLTLTMNLKPWDQEEDEETALSLSLDHGD